MFIRAKLENEEGARGSRVTLLRGLQPWSSKLLYL